MERKVQQAGKNTSRIGCCGFVLSEFNGTFDVSERSLSTSPAPSAAFWTQSSTQQ